jgi:hypothetical protein
MKYNININQLELSKTNIDIIDASILDYVITMCNSLSKAVQAKRIDGYTWINYKRLISDMPLLKINSKSALTPRFKKLELAGFILIRYLDGGRFFISLTDKVDSLFIDTVHINEQSVLEDEQQPFVKTNIHNNTKDNNTNKLEPAAQENEIRYTSLEDEVRGLKKPQKVDDPKLTERRAIIGYFIRKSKEIHNYCPQIALIPALKLVKDLQSYNEDTDLRGLVDWFLESEMYDKLGSDIKICFSLASYNKWMDYKRKH